LGWQVERRRDASEARLRRRVSPPPTPLPKRRSGTLQRCGGACDGGAGVGVGRADGRRKKGSADCDADDLERRGAALTKGGGAPRPPPSAVSA